MCGLFVWLAGFSFSARAQTPSGGYWQAVTNASPLAYWRLNETNGATVAADLLGFHNGTISASVTPGVSGPQSPLFPGFETTNTAMQFNYASGSYLTVPALNLNTNTVTICGWINPTGTQAAWTGIAFCRGGSTCAGLNFGPGSIANELRYTWNNSRWDKSTGLSVPAGQWSFFALVVTPTNAVIYLGTNGVLSSFMDVASEPNQAFDASLLIGYDPSEGSRLFRGSIDEVAIFNHSLTATQIQQVYTSALTLPTPLPPSGLSAIVVSATEIDLSWVDNSSDEDGFKIERALDNAGSPDAWTQVGAVSTNVTNYSDTALSPNTTYWYRVRAYGAGGNSDYSNWANAHTVPLTATLSVAPSVTNVCVVVDGAKDGGQQFVGIMTAGELYSYQASGCIGLNVCGSGCLSSNPNGDVFSGNACSGSSTTITASSSFKCPGLVAYSLVASISGSCIQLGGGGSFTAPSTGPLFLYFNDDNYFDNSGSFNVCIEIPEFGLVSRGAIGGPFSPFNRLYTLTNSGSTSLGWSATNSQSWVTLSSTSGTLDVGGSTTVTASINADANGLAAGAYADSIIFTNLTFGNGSTVRPVSLTVIGIPAAPSALSAIGVSTNRINLAWTDNSTNEDGFSIERAPDTSGVPGVWAQVVTVSSNATSYGDTGLASATTYWYRLRAYNIAGYSDYSGAANATTLIPPAAPSGLSATAVTSSQINLSWTDNSSNESGFRIERAPDVGGIPGTWAQIASVSSNVTTYSNTGRASGTTYWYRIRAYNSSDNSPYSNVASATTPGLPPAPSNLMATVISSNRVDLGWTDNSGNEDGFKIERAPDGGILNWTQIAAVASNVTGFSDFGVVTNKTYWYRVRAYNSSGNSAYTTSVKASVPALPGAPSNLAAVTVSSNQINLTWKDNANNEDGFKIERAPDIVGTPGTWTQIAIATTNITSYSDVGLAGTTRYWYRIRAYNVSGHSPYSNTANASTAEGQNVWINPASDKWEIGPNWSQGVPSSSQTAVLITNSNTKTVTIDAATAASNALNGCMAIGALTIQAPDGSTNKLALSNGGSNTPLHVINSLTITNGGAMSITNSALQVDGDMRVDGQFAIQPDTQVVMSNASMYVGSVATGRVAMSGGTMNVRTLVVASNVFSAGSFSMTGGSLVYSNLLLGVASNTSASAWLTGGELVTTNRVVSITISRFGNAEMTVSNGASVHSWLTWIGVGNSGVGTFTVAGGNADLGGLTVGGSSNATAAAWISSGQVAATNQGITIASSSSLAQMTISNANVLVGNQFGGATFNIAGGSYGTGALTMCAGTLTSTGLTDTWYIGFNSGSKGSVWIDGGTVTATNGGYLFLGLEGAGEWTMTNGSVAVANLYEGLLGGTGTLRIPGGTFSVLSNTTLAGASSTVWVTGGQFLTPDGAVILGYGPSSMIISSGLAVARNMNISLNNAASGVLSIYGGQVVLFDSLVVGNCASNAIGQVTVNGGILYVTNSTHTGCLDLSGGTLTLNSGSIIVDQLIMTNPCAKLVRTGGTLVYGTALLDPNASAVGDGIPNGWKQQYGLDPFDPNLANEDSDGDGMSNLQEYLAGTDPTNSASAFRITSVVSTGNDILVNWMTGIGRTNALQALTNPEFTNNFTDIFTVTNAVGTTTNYLDIGAATNVPSRFYRVRLVP